MKTQDSGMGNFWIKYYITHLAVWEGNPVTDISQAITLFFLNSSKLPTIIQHTHLNLVN